MNDAATIASAHSHHEDSRRHHSGHRRRRRRRKIRLLLIAVASGILASVSAGLIIWYLNRPSIPKSSTYPQIPFVDPVTRR